MEAATGDERIIPRSPRRLSASASEDSPPKAADLPTSLEGKAEGAVAGNWVGGWVGGWVGNSALIGEDGLLAGILEIAWRILTLGYVNNVQKA